ncbi:unnamed protein product [Lactuca saligna]|uniref:Uncharacterized protein n=1 Tax=Lactuca saligna TaxID=75948 RepID=A0AA35ZDS8_LACSI|nr:unnamed protein product [Lactuca saligna]
MYNTRLDFAQLFLHQARDEGYYGNHGISIPIRGLSSKIINVAPTEDDLHIAVRMQKWIDKPYLVESFDSEEEDEDDNDVVQRGSNPPLVVTAEPLIQDEISARLAFPSPLVENVPPMLKPIQTTTLYHGESTSNFEKIILSQLSLLVKITQ